MLLESSKVAPKISREVTSTIYSREALESLQDLLLESVKVELLESFLGRYLWNFSGFLLLSSFLPLESTGNAP